MPFVPQTGGGKEFVASRRPDADSFGAVALEAIPERAQAAGDRDGTTRPAAHAEHGDLDPRNVLAAG